MQKNILDYVVDIAFMTRQVQSSGENKKGKSALRSNVLSVLLQKHDVPCELKTTNKSD